MRLPVSILLVASLFPLSGHADITEFHAGLAELDAAELGYPEIRDDSGSSYRLIATNYLEPAKYSRLGYRQDIVRPSFPSSYSYQATDAGGAQTTTEVPAGTYNAKRRVLYFGFGERWGGPGMSYGVEIGAAQVRVQQWHSGWTATAVETGPGNFTTTNHPVSDFEHEDTSAYLGMDLKGRFGGLEWQVDTIYLEEVPALLDHDDPVARSEAQTWTGANLAYYYEGSSAFGIRFERAAGIESATIFLRWGT